MQDSGLQWLMRPVIEKLVSYDKIYDPDFGLLDFALMHEALDVREENQRRIHAKLNKK